tara:strand:- start:2147 stop:2425 length:279 start_codon:yes stop_codon:yes gene_type:complete
MKSILITILVLILPITIYATEVIDVEVCKRVEGCKLIFSSKTMETYCPTCVKESIIISPLAKPKRINRNISLSSNKFDWIKWITKDYLKYIL